MQDFEKRKQPSLGDTIQRAEANKRKYSNLIGRKTPTDGLDTIRDVSRIAAIVFFKRFEKRIREEQIRWLYDFLFDQIIHTAKNGGVFYIPSFGRFYTVPNKGFKKLDEEGNVVKFKPPHVNFRVILTCEVKRYLHDKQHYRELEVYDDLDPKSVPTQNIEKMEEFPLEVKEVMRLNRKHNKDKDVKLKTKWIDRKMTSIKREINRRPRTETLPSE